MFLKRQMLTAVPERKSWKWGGVLKSTENSAESRNYLRREGMANWQEKIVG
ncbi:hypothetical protein Mapa_009080 [Marchantia paleacea]|nr:hypothetical protein Mapa_009080 [Marchantia paleacea]